MGIRRVGSDSLVGYQRRVPPSRFRKTVAQSPAVIYHALWSRLALCVLPVAPWSQEGHSVLDPPFLAIWYTFLLPSSLRRSPAVSFTMYSSSRCSSLSLALLVLSLLELALAVPLPASVPAPLLKSSKTSTSTRPKKGGIVLPFGRQQRREVKRQTKNGDVVGGEVGLGDSADL